MTTEALPAVSRAILAKLLGISERQASRLESAQVLIPRSRPTRGRPVVYEVGENVRSYLVYKLRESPRDRRDAAQAAYLEHRLALAQGRVLPRDQVVREGTAICAAITAKLRALPIRLSRAGVIPREGEPEVTRAIEEMQVEMSRWRTLEDLRAAATEPDPLPRRQPGRKEKSVYEPEEHRH